MAKNKKTTPKLPKQIPVKQSSTSVAKVQKNLGKPPKKGSNIFLEYRLKKTTDNSILPYGKKK